jgi:hypothetical protein
VTTEARRKGRRAVPLVISNPDSTQQGFDSASSISRRGAESIRTLESRRSTGTKNLLPGPGERQHDLPDGVEIGHKCGGMSILRVGDVVWEGFGEIGPRSIEDPGTSGMVSTHRRSSDGDNLDRSTGP